MKEFIIKLEKNRHEIEEYEREEKNIVKVSFQIFSDSKTEKDCRVTISLSNEAKIGLGTALIRSALNKNSIGVEQLYPMEKNNVIRDFGIHLHPDSCELLITDEDFGTVEDVLKALAEQE